MVNYEAKRKFESIREMLHGAYLERPGHLAFRYLENDDVVDVTLKEFYESVEALGAALTRRGYIHGHVACVGDNSYPWLQTYLCCLMGDGVFVPLDRDLPADTLVRLLRESDSGAVFCDGRHLEMLRAHREEIPGIECIICFDLEEDAEDALSFARLLEEGKDLPKEDYDSQKRDPYLMKQLVYTSGTTGEEKGVMLTEHNLVSCVYYGVQISNVLTCGLSVLPYHHTYGAVCDILVGLYSFATLCINDKLKNIANNVKRFSPDYIMVVPAISEHFYAAIMKSVKKQGKEKGLKLLIGISQVLRHLGIDRRRKFFSAIHAQFGGRLTKIVCGGAPIRPEIGAFFDKIGVTLQGGYGITECSPLISSNDVKKNNFHTAGHRLPCLEWRIDSPDEDGIGEICVKGDTVMLGYYKRPDLTAEVLKDGWFYTGDYGFLTPDDQVTITGRKKNIVVLTNGKNVYPEELENRIACVDYITDVVVSGMKNEHGQDYGLQAEIYMAEDPGKTEDEIFMDVRRSMEGEPPYKQITSLKIRKEPFVKTTTQKIKRNA